MNQDMSAGLGAGLMNLGSMFSQMLMKRMDSKWEDEAYEKRLAAAQKAELAKLKAIDEYNATKTAGFAPVVQPGPDGKPQYLEQPINPIGAPLGGTQPMAAHRQTAFQIQQEANARKIEKENLDMDVKRRQGEAFEARAEVDRARAEGRIGGPRAAKEKDLTKEIFDINKDLSALEADLPTELQEKLKVKRNEARGLVKGADGKTVQVPVTDAEVRHSLMRTYEELLAEWHQHQDFLKMRQSKRANTTRNPNTGISVFDELK